MAASGVAEHNEARRKERYMQKMAYKQKALMSQLEDEYGNCPDLLGADVKDTYLVEVNQMRKSGSPPGRVSDARHDAAYVDQIRRNQIRQQQLCEYSAKIPNRFSSKDYIAQW